VKNYIESMIITSFSQYASSGVTRGLSQGGNLVERGPCATAKTQ